jgi:hypothetical protein
MAHGNVQTHHTRAQEKKKEITQVSIGVKIIRILAKHLQTSQ